MPWGRLSPPLRKSIGLICGIALIGEKMERTATDRLRVNEKLKVGSAVIANAATVLLAAAFGRWFLGGIDGWVIIWFVFAGTGIAIAIQLMSFLDAESEDG
jgi:hypothetical protein